MHEICFVSLIFHGTKINLEREDQSISFIVAQRKRSTGQT